MKRNRRLRGFSLMEVLVALGVLGITVVMALALFGSSRLLRDRSGYASRAASLVQRKMEQVRMLKTSLINASGLRSAGVIDTPSSTTTFSFTSTDSVSTQMPGGRGTLTITSGGSDLVRVDVTVNWTGLRGKAESVTATTYVANKSVWKDTTAG